MNWEVLIKIASAATPIITAVIGYLKSEGAPVNLIKKKQKLLAHYPSLPTRARSLTNY